jgi:hypothetical protein
VDKQRLIFRGHLLDDSKLITDNKIENKDVVHLIARMEGTNSSQNNNNNQGNRATEQNIFIRSPPILPFIALRDLNPSRNSNERSGGGLFGDSGFFGRSSLRIISSTSTYPGYGRSTEYAQQPTLNSDEIRETIAQNLLEVQNMIDYGNYKEFNDSDFNEENKMEEEDDEKNINIEKKEEKKEEKKKDEKKETDL